MKMMISGARCGEFISGNYPMETVKLRRGILRERRELSGDRQLD
jgi:hypothetical protein